MSGYSRSCSRTDSSILLAAQCAAALSMMPASAPSCCTQGVTAASYNEYAIWDSSFGAGLHGRDHTASQRRGCGKTGSDVLALNLTAHDKADTSWCAPARP